jgi:hypothetical protein
LWNRNLSGFFYSWLDSAFYTNIWVGLIIPFHYSSIKILFH